VEVISVREKIMIIGLYGINRVGKSRQVELLAERIRKEWGPVESLKFPMYKLEPTGPLINNYLRPVDGVKNPHQLTPREFQLLNVQNKKDAQKVLSDLSKAGHLILEDYTGTAIAWGMGTGVSKDLLETLHSGFITEDVAILLDGEPFLSGTEKGHTHEENDVLTDAVRKIHQTLAEEYSWHIVASHRDEGEVHEEIWKCVSLYRNV